MQGQDRGVGVLMTELKTVFISAPFAGDVENNIKRAEFYGKKAFELGFVPYISHSIYPKMVIETEENRGVLMDCCRTELALRDWLWICGTNITEGMRTELRDWFALMENEGMYPRKRCYPWCVVWDGNVLHKTPITDAEWEYRMEWVEKIESK